MGFLFKDRNIYISSGSRIEIGGQGAKCLVMAYVWGQGAKGLVWYIFSYMKSAKLGSGGPWPPESAAIYVTGHTGMLGGLVGSPK